MQLCVRVRDWRGRKEQCVNEQELHNTPYIAKGFETDESDILKLPRTNKEERKKEKENQ